MTESTWDTKITFQCLIKLPHPYWEKDGGIEGLRSAYCKQMGSQGIQTQNPVSEGPTS